MIYAIPTMNGAQSDLIRAENMLAIAQIELNKAVVQLQSAIEGDTPGLPDRPAVELSTVQALDKLLQKLADKFQ